MAASNFTDLYNYGSYGYMGIGPMPAYSFTLTINAEGSGNSFWLGNCTSTHIVAYNPSNTSQYAVYSGESFTVYTIGSSSRMLVTGSPLTYPDVPASQTITVSNKASDWDFHGLASLEGAALCIATNASGSSPDGHDYGSISSSQKLWFSYEKIVVLMADKINGRDIYAKRAEQDKDGNDIVPIPAITGNAGKVLTVNSGATGVEWATPSGGSGALYIDYGSVSLSTRADALALAEQIQGAIDANKAVVLKYTDYYANTFYLSLTKFNLDPTVGSESGVIQFMCGANVVTEPTGTHLYSYLWNVTITTSGFTDGRMSYFSGDVSAPTPIPT